MKSFYVILCSIILAYTVHWASIQTDSSMFLPSGFWEFFVSIIAISSAAVVVWRVDLDEAERAKRDDLMMRLETRQRVRAGEVARRARRWESKVQDVNRKPLSTEEEASEQNLRRDNTAGLKRLAELTARASHATTVTACSPSEGGQIGQSAVKR